MPRSHQNSVQKLRGFRAIQEIRPGPWKRAGEGLDGKAFMRHQPEGPLPRHPSGYGDIVELVAISEIATRSPDNRRDRSGWPRKRHQYRSRCGPPARPLVHPVPAPVGPDRHVRSAIGRSVRRQRRQRQARRSKGWQTECVARWSKAILGRAWDRKPFPRPSWELARRYKRQRTWQERAREVAGLVMCATEESCAVVGIVPREGSTAVASAPPRFHSGPVSAERRERQC